MNKLKKIKKKEKINKSTQNQENLPKPKITDPVLMAKALVASEGNEYNAAEILGITTKTLRKHIKNNDTLAEIKDHILSYQISFAEEQLMTLIKFKDFQAIKYFLDSRGKDHGYGKNATQEGITNKTGVLLINNMTVNNTNLNPDDWSEVAISKRQEQKIELDKKTIDLNLQGED